ncbi:MAG: efflux RND transporter permease subunit [Rubrobacteraceae bacterium]
MRAIVSWALRHKSVVILATLLLVLAGTYGTARLNQELLPEIDFPAVSVITPVPGASPEAVDDQVTQPIESSLEGVEGLEEVNSTSSQGVSVVQASFDFNTDLDAVESEIRRNIDGVTLPDQALDSEIAQGGSGEFPIEILSIATDGGDGNSGDEELGDSNDDNLQGLSSYVEDEAVPRLEEIEGVGSVDVAGSSERVIEVELDPAALAEDNLTATAVTSAIQEANADTPAGEARIEGLSTPIQASGELSDVKALRQLPVGTSGGTPSGGASGGGAPSGGAMPAGATSAPETAEPEAQEQVLLQDVATIEEVDSNLTGVSRTDGEQSLTLTVSKEPDANTVEISEEVDVVLGEIRDDLGDAGQATVVYEDAEQITEAINDLLLKALIAAAVAVIIIMLFLRSWKATLVTAVSLPTSVLVALLFSWGYDITLNIITMGGLIIAIGRVVDDAIVVLENSYRYIQMGYGSDEAALKGTTEVGSAITSSTLVTVAVFMPLGLVGGLVSELFLPLALTVSLALIASLVVAITIIPVLISLFLRRRVSRGAVPDAEKPASGDGQSHESQGWLVRLYTPALRWSLSHRWVVLAVAGVLFVAGLSLATLLPQIFFPESESDSYLAEIELPEGTLLQDTSDAVDRFEEFLADDPGVETYQVSIGGETSLSASPGNLSGDQPDNQASVTIGVSEDADADTVVRRIEEEGNDLYGGRNFQVSGLQGGISTGSIEATITEGSEKELREAADLVAQELRDNPDVNNVDTSITGGAPQISVTIDEQRAAEAGISTAAATQSIAALFDSSAQRASQTTINGNPVITGVPEASLTDLGSVRNLPVAPDTTVGDIADVEESTSASSVNRVDGEQTVTVSGEITADDTTAVTSDVNAALDDLDLPGDTQASIGGESEDIAEGFGDLFVAIAVAIALVYLILVTFFRSVIIPLSIMLSLPLVTIGAFGALLVTGTPLSISSMLGILLLIGIVVANAILLVDFAVKAKEHHGSLADAIVEAGQARLRPVLMTAAATIGALSPLALGIGSGSALITSALAIPVIGGLITSTLLTLLVVPAGYSLLEGARSRFRGSRKTTRREASSGPDEDTERAVLEPAGIPSSGPTDGQRAADGHEGSHRPPESDIRYELGRARGQIEILQRTLERQERELREHSRNGAGGLVSQLRKLLR